MLSRTQASDLANVEGPKVELKVDHRGLGERHGDGPKARYLAKERGQYHPDGRKGVDAAYSGLQGDAFDGRDVQGRAGLGGVPPEGGLQHELLLVVGDEADLRATNVRHSCDLYMFKQAPSCSFSQCAAWLSTPTALVQWPTHIN
eukprot:scaffold459497_cov43-Prasinocladus_malaysianus.AAC.1